MEDEIITKHRTEYRDQYQKAVNKYVRDFTNDFCKEDGSIDWENLVRFNSGEKGVESKRANRKNKRIKPRDAIMPTFDVHLTRTYRVRISAQDEASARELAEFFVGGVKDDSNERDRSEHQFEISDLKMVVNDAFESEAVTDE